MKMLAKWDHHRLFSNLNDSSNCFAVGSVFRLVNSKLWATWINKEPYNLKSFTTRAKAMRAVELEVSSDKQLMSRL